MDKTAGSRVLGVLHDCLARPDADSWDALIEVLNPNLSRVIGAVLSDWGRNPRAEEHRDILQEVFLKLASNNGAILSRVPTDSEPAALAYLKAIAANCARDYLKGEHAGKRGLDLTASIEITLPSLASDLDLDHMDQQVLFYQVDKLLRAEEPLRSWFWLYYREGYSNREIAGLYGADFKEKGVESAIYRAVQSVKEQLSKNIVNSEPMKESVPGKSL